MARMAAAINDMLLDMLAAVARKDSDRRRRQMQGQAVTKAAGKYTGRPENKRRNQRIATMLAAGSSYNDVQVAAGPRWQSVCQPGARDREGRPSVRDRSSRS
jgi:DNA invertase Pin-like site-specific DNA recombinase